MDERERARERERPAGSRAERQDFVTLAEALAIFPLLPVAEEWLGPSSCSFDIVSPDGVWTRKARFLLHTMIGDDDVRWKRWVIQNRLLMDGTTPEMIAQGAAAGIPIDAVALLLHEKLDLERKLSLARAELSVASVVEESGEEPFLRAALEAVVAERDRLADELDQAAALLEEVEEERRARRAIERGDWDARGRTDD